MMQTNQKDNKTVRMERALQERVEQRHPFQLLGGQGVGGIGRLLTEEEAPDIFEQARLQAKLIEKKEEELKSLNEQIDLLTNRRLRVVAEASSFKHALLSYAQIADVSPLFPESMNSKEQQQDTKNEDHVAIRPIRSPQLQSG